MEKILEKYRMNDKCPVRNILDRFGDKWSILVILLLGDQGTLRFNKLTQLIGDVSQKMLTVTLRKLEADGLVTRTVYPEIPPRVEYTLTPTGEELLPLIKTLTDWAVRNMDTIKTSRARFEAERTVK